MQLPTLTAEWRSPPTDPFLHIGGILHRKPGQVVGEDGALFFFHLDRMWQREWRSRWVLFLDRDRWSGQGRTRTLHRRGSRRGGVRPTREGQTCPTSQSWGRTLGPRADRAVGTPTPNLVAPREGFDACNLKFRTYTITREHPCSSIYQLYILIERDA
jgi:hypothetical protein